MSNIKIHFGKGITFNSPVAEVRPVNNLQHNIIYVKNNQLRMLAPGESNQALTINVNNEFAWQTVDIPENNTWWKVALNWNQYSTTDGGSRVLRDLSWTDIFSVNLYESYIIPNSGYIMTPNGNYGIHVQVNGFENVEEFNDPNNFLTTRTGWKAAQLRTDTRNYTYEDGELQWTSFNGGAQRKWYKYDKPDIYWRPASGGVWEIPQMMLSAFISPSGYTEQHGYYDTGLENVAPETYSDVHIKVKSAEKNYVFTRVEPINPSAAETSGWLITEDNFYQDNEQYKGYNAFGSGTWHTKNNSQKHWLQWQSLTEPVLLQKIAFSSQNDGSYNWWPTEFTIEASNNGSEWTVLATKTISYDRYTDSYVQVEFLNNETKYSYFKLNITKCIDNYVAIKSLQCIIKTNY